MSSRIVKNSLIAPTLCVVCVLTAASPSLAGGSTCVDGPYSRVCVEWSEQDPPLPGIDFAVDFTDPVYPNIELIEGDLGWVVWSEYPDGSPANIGSLTTTDSEHYGVKIANGTGPGAHQVRSLVLTPPGDHFGRIDTGSTISGDLEGELRVQGYSAFTATLDLEIGGDLSGSAHVGVLLPGRDLIVHGDVTGSVEIVQIGAVTGAFWVDGDVSGTIHVEEIFQGALTVLGNLSGEITVDSMPAGRVDIETLTGSLEISNLSGLSLIFNSVVEIGSDQAEMLGKLRLPDGIGFFATVTIWDLTAPGKVDLVGQEVAGDLFLWMGGNGNIENGGTVSGQVWVPQASAGLYSGTATFSSVSANGPLGVINSTRLDGTVNIIGDIDGHMTIDNLLADGAIEIGGDLLGDLTIAADMAGNVNVDGLCAGSIDIAEETKTLSLINLKGGLASTGTITINSSEGNFSAHGDIRVGPAGQYCALPLPLGPFAGTITVKDSSAGPGYGGFKGQIDVGCLGSGVSGDIVVEGGVGGDITIRQDASGKIDLQGAFGKTGQIVCTGLYSGDIEIARGTGSLTLIHLEGGLGNDGSVVVNHA